MPDILPPAPVDAPFTSYNWADWYKKVRDAINASSTVAWSIITGKPTTVSALALSDLTSGTYTPTLTNTTNIDSSTAYTAQYLRVGNVVTVSGAVTIDPTATGDTIMGISLPVTSDISNSENAGGAAICQGIAQYGVIYGDSANNRVNVRIQAIDASSKDYYFTFTYRVI